jgi:hypothetical protein
MKLSEHHIELFKGGTPIKDLAYDLGVSTYSVKLALKGAGIDPSQKKWQRLSDESLAAYADGCSLQELTRLTGRSRMSLIMELADRGIKARVERDLSRSGKAVEGYTEEDFQAYLKGELSPLEIARRRGFSEGLFYKQLKAAGYKPNFKKNAKASSESAKRASNKRFSDLGLALRHVPVPNSVPVQTEQLEPDTDRFWCDIAVQFNQEDVAAWVVGWKAKKVAIKYNLPVDVAQKAMLWRVKDWTEEDFAACFNDKSIPKRFGTLPETVRIAMLQWLC